MQGKNPFCKEAALYSSCHNAFNNIFLAEKIEHNNRDDRQNQYTHHSSHINRTVTAFQILDSNRNGGIFFQIQYQIRKQIVIPDPHGLKDRYGHAGRFHDRKYHSKEGLQRVAAIDHSRFLDLQRNGFDKAGKHEDRKTGAKAKIDDPESPGSVQLQSVCQL